MKVYNVMNCSFSSWYPKFKDSTIKSLVIPLPQEFVDYLFADGVVLPESSVTGGSAGACECAGAAEDDQDNRSYDEELDNIDWSTEDDSTPVVEPPSFPEFEDKVKKCINKLGGKVFPKLNWSAPRDATWISFDKTLKCTCPSDVYLLLKSSEFISHDLTQPFIYCDDDENLKQETKVQYELVLRKWVELNPAFEFRCFVKDNQVTAITQRHNNTFYKFIGDNHADIVNDIQAFFHHVIRGNFPDKTFVFDVYRRDQGKLLLLDFNPFGEVTDGLLFTWEELFSDGPLRSSGQPVAGDDHQGPAFRYVDMTSGVQPSPYSRYAMPKDFVDLATGEDPQKLIDFLQMRTQNQDDSSDEDTPDNRHIIDGTGT